jgi:hypothetical protein
VNMHVDDGISRAPGCAERFPAREPAIANTSINRMTHPLQSQSGMFMLTALENRADDMAQRDARKRADAADVGGMFPV